MLVVSQHFRDSRLRCFAIALFFAIVAGHAQAVIFYDTSDPSYNTGAPGGTLSGSGWQYEGYFGSYLGTMIGPDTFITAQHFGVNDNKFVYDSVFSGASSVTYNIDTAANGGVGYYDIAGTDLRIYKITGTFSTYAPVYTGSSELSTGISDFVVVGRGTQRGSDVTVGGNLRGWLWGAGDGVARWGTNQYSSVTTVGGLGDMLTANFNPLAGTSEATLSGGDSGGASFIKVGGTWYLAGINYGVESTFSYTSGGATFSAAIFDKGGLYENGSFIPNTGADQSTTFYMSRVSASSAAIDSITGVPEPASAVLIVCAGFVFCIRRVRRG